MHANKVSFVPNSQRYRDFYSFVFPFKFVIYLFHTSIDKKMIKKKTKNEKRSIKKRFLFDSVVLPI